ncbi:RagB/SusD family nutrient uptake outer membrane protein [uncultured Sanguibacteroides sp.]|uniref:RagB/SusD family nutrient uptake outer membrane protein n=1 Tax=uncultured Sanguibacteroides sp. TaxID=1635151 RepID=UPI0025E945A6|nr:RagB/SusD family nutrient uptake outer membrane protein [uncultured Sanguibacteroides sp.]
MNRWLLYILCGFIFTSCGDFLEEKSQDLIIPKTVKDYSEFLFGEGYIRDNIKMHEYLDIMTDDVEEKAESYPMMAMDIRSDGYGYYCWQPNPEYRFTGVLNADNAWEVYYNKILIANNIINLIDKADGSEADKKDLKGEAYFLRAYAYFMLVNLYGEPYEKATADRALGIPLNFDNNVQERFFVRESVARSYKQIEDDLKESIRLLEETNYTKKVFRVSRAAAYLLASRVYLYMKDYKNTIEYADKVLGVNANLYDISVMGEEDVVISPSNPEIIWTYGNYDISYLSQANRGCFPVSNVFYNSFDDDDLRKTCYFKEEWNEVSVNKSKANSGMYGFAFRTAEAYLNRAEANAELGNTQLALDDLKHLRQYRFKKEVPLTATKETIVDLVRAERRFELCYEQHRWFDLRRWDRPRIEHTYTLDIMTGQKEKFVLEKDDEAYTLPLPVEVSEFDYGLENIKRPERKGVQVN